MHKHRKLAMINEIIASEEYKASLYKQWKKLCEAGIDIENRIEVINDHAELDSILPSLSQERHDLTEVETELTKEINEIDAHISQIRKILFDMKKSI